MKPENPPVMAGDKIQIGTRLKGGGVFWGSIQTVIRLSSGNVPVYRPKFAKVEKYASLWRLIRKS